MQLSTDSSLLWYKLANSLKDSHMKMFEAQPTVTRDVATFKEKIGDIKSVDDLMKNRTVLTMVMSAFQLESEVGKTAMVRKILTEDPADKDSLVNKLVEPRWAKLASALYGLNSDPDFFQNQSNVDTILAGSASKAAKAALYGAKLSRAGVDTLNRRWQPVVFIQVDHVVVDPTIG